MPVTQLRLGTLFGLAALASSLAIQPAMGQEGMTYWTYAVDGSVFRSIVGYSRMTMSSASPTTDRAAQGVNMRAEARVISGLLGQRRGFAAHDALFTDVIIHKLTSTPLADAFGDPEQELAYAWAYGYELLLGWRGERVAVFAGGRAQKYMVEIGGSTLDGWTTPVVAAAQLRFSSKRYLLASGWFSPSGERKTSGVEVALPLGSRWWVTYVYNRATGPVGLWNATVPMPGRVTSMVLGLRIGFMS